MQQVTRSKKQMDDRIECPQFVEMPEQLSRSFYTSTKPLRSLSSDQDRPFMHHQYRYSGDGYHHKYKTSHKARKTRQTPPAPCMKFLSGYGCSYGEKCRFSHDLQAFYSVYYESTGYDDSIWPAVYAMPRQNYTQRQMPRVMKPSVMPSKDSAQYLSMFCTSPQRERASSLVNHFKSHDNQVDSVPVSASGKLLYKEAVLKQSKVKQSERKRYDATSHKSSDKDEYGDESCPSNEEIATHETESVDTTRQHQRRKKNLRSRKCGVLNNSVDGDSTEFCRNPNYLFREVRGADLVRTCAQQQPQRKEQEVYLHPTRAAQMMHPMSLSYARYLSEEHFFSHLSSQVEAFVDYIDTKLTSVEMHQHQAIDSLQELVHSLWPDALIDVYGSSYSHLALPASDIDCVLVSKSLIGERPLAILKALSAEVERQPWTKQLKLLGNAKIPVLKMTNSLDPTQPDVLLDLTCGHSVGHTGLDARDLVYSLQTEMPALRPLVLVLKSHLVSNQLNCAFTGGISSYVLVILVIRFLQACGDTHHKSFTGSSIRKVRNGNRTRSYSENAPVCELPEEFAYNASLGDAAIVHPKWCYTFSRGGRVTWRTGIGSLLLLFLETYITFDYRRFGISIDNEGEFFLLPPDKVVPMQCSVVIPYVADPIKPGRSICNCFRMHEVIQSWLELYQNLAAGVPVTTCVDGDLTS
ncbi:unnamed protein product [Peronospora destructor]|uniref:C3H1-type domain-containing protein n=1 Tax=Peronospora destructor TaxID=86335 RepID=A0AAV0U4J0_9STRA|nr:unnamed protein product [Peronospora destructor]